MSRTLHIKPLVFTDRLLQAVQASPTQFLTVTQRGVQLWQIREGEVLRLRETQLDHPLLLVLTLQHRLQIQDHVITVITGESQPGTGAWACRMAWISQQGPADHGVALNTPQSQNNEATFSREPHPSCSNTVCPSASPGLCIGAVGVYKGCVHVYGTSGEVHKSKQAVTQTMYDFTAVAAAADPYQEGIESLHIYSQLTLDGFYFWFDQQSGALQVNALFMQWRLCLLPPTAKHYSWCAWCPTQVCRHRIVLPLCQLWSISTSYHT